MAAERSLRRLRVIRDLEPRSAGFMGLEAGPRLLAGDVVLECPGPAEVAESEIAVVLQLGGPWFAVPADAVEDVGDL
jgi:hypothetical protein